MFGRLLHLAVLGTLVLGGASAQSAENRDISNSTVTTATTTTTTTTAAASDVLFTNTTANETNQAVKAPEPEIDPALVPAYESSSLEIMATVERAPKSVHVDKLTSRVFFSYHSDRSNPSDQSPVLMELVSVGETRAFPADQTGLVAVQALHCRESQPPQMVVLDAGDDEFPAKIMVYDLNSEEGRLVKKYEFPREVAPVGSKLADFTMSFDSRHIFVVDSAPGPNGKPGLIVLDTKTWTATRALNNHASVVGKQDASLEFVSKESTDKRVAGVALLALGTQGGSLVFGAPTSEHLWSVPTESLTGIRHIGDPNYREKRLNNVPIPSPEVAAFRAFNSSMTFGLSVDFDADHMYSGDRVRHALWVTHVARNISRVLVQSDDLLRYSEGMSTGVGYLYVACPDTPTGHHLVRVRMIPNEDELSRVSMSHHVPVPLNDMTV